MANAERAKPSFENTVKFLSSSTAPIDRKTYYPTKHPNQSQKEWERMYQIVGYYMLTDEALEEIGHRYGVTRERVRQVVKDGITRLHHASEEHVQTQYRQESLGFTKSLTLESRKRRSLAGGGRSVKVAELAKAGKSTEEIRRELGLSGTQLAESRLVLRRWNVANLEYLKKASYPDYKEKINRLKTQNLSDQEVEETLNSVTFGTYQYNSQGETPLFYPASNLAKEAGIFISAREVLYLSGLLRGNRIPVGVVERILRKKTRKGQKVLRYYFIFSGHKERALEVLQTNHALDRYRTNPVRALRSQDETVPSTYELQFSGAYSYVGKLLAEFGHARFSHQFKLTISDLIGSDCPVPVYQSRLGNFYESSQKEALRAYLAKRIEEVRRAKVTKQE